MIRGLLSAFFVFIAYCISAQSSSRVTLFSPGGDTVLTYTGYQFGGPTIDSLMFSVGTKNAGGVKWFERFVVPNKVEVTSDDYPKKIVSKYKLFNEGIDQVVDSCPDIEVTQINLENKKVEMVQPANDHDSACYLFKCIKNINIRICGKLVVKNLELEYDYISYHKHDNKIPVNFLVPVFSKMEDRNKYYAAVVVWDMKVKYIPSKDPNELDHTKKSCTNLFQGEYILSYGK